MRGVSKDSKPASVESEFNALFIGLGRGELFALRQLLPDGIFERKAFGDAASRHGGARHHAGEKRL